MVPSVNFPPSLSFADQAVLITGANVGLGLETAIHYVQLGAAPVIISARNAARGAEAVATIEARTSKKGVVQARTLDMSSFGNVKKFVDDLQREVKSIDIVLLNAGVFSVDYHPSPEGWEEDLQVNTLSTTLLALLLLPWMRAVKQPDKLQHLSIVGSGSHTKVDISAPEWPKQDILKYFNDESNYNGGPPAYATSKLLVQYAANETAKLAVDSDGNPSPIINVVCPGRVSTNIARKFAAKSIIHKGLVWAFMALGSLTPEVGSRQLVLAAVTTPAEHGKFIRPYLTDAEYEKYAGKSITNDAGKKMQLKVWEEILEVLEAAVPGVKDIAHSKL